MTHWLLGYPDQALQRNQEALALAHPFSLAFALVWAAILYQYRWEAHATREKAEALIALSREQGFAQRLAIGTILQGWALAEQGQAEEGITHIRQGLTAYRAMGGEWSRPHYLALMAKAYGKVRQAKDGLRILAEALAVGHNTGDRVYEAEVYRLQGEMLQGQAVPDAVQAETCFQQALAIARHQQAKAWELRAATSLARLWQQQGKRAEARELLAPTYGWFTEGFDTADLQEAKALLEELGA